MSIFLKKMDKITIDDIEDFISELHPENIRLEYKQDFSSKDANLQIAKEVSAFANQQGGVIVYGVKEKSDRMPDTIMGLDKNTSPRKKIQRVCIDHIYPPIFPEIQECELKGDPDKVVVLIRLPMSNETPHTINGRRGFYIRGDDTCEPRPMTEEEISLLWDRRRKLEDRRDWLLRRSRKRVFATARTQENLTHPISLMAIPAYPMNPLVERNQLLDLHRNAGKGGMDDFPFFTDRIKTASDSIYSYLPHKNDDETIRNVAKKQYGEINTFGQIAHMENALQTFRNRTGIFLYQVVKLIYYLATYSKNFYAVAGYWGIVKLIVRIENCIGQKLQPISDYWVTDPTEIEMDNEIAIERDIPVAQLVEQHELVICDILKELLWDSGYSAHRARSINAYSFLQFFKMDRYGKKICPKCNKKNISNIDEMCSDCIAST